MGYWTILFTVIACFFNGSLQDPNEARLLNDLMKDYNRLVRPVTNYSNAVTVKFGMSLSQIMDLDESEQVLTTNVMLRQSWTDKFLQWNEADYAGIDQILLPVGVVWKPDIQLFNSAEPKIETVPHLNVYCTSNGVCNLIPQVILKSSCIIHSRWFPFDVQRCDLKFGSWHHSGLKLDLELDDQELELDHHYVPSREWELIDNSSMRGEAIYACCPEEAYPYITVTLVLQRRTLYYGLTLLLPGIILSTLALMVFLLPADSGEKITLGITVLLSLVVLMLMLEQVMPKTSDSVPVLAQFFAAILVIVALSVAATVVVLQCHHHDPRGAKMPKWMKVLLSFASSLGVKRPGSDPTSVTSLLMSPDNTPSDSKGLCIALDGTDCKTGGEEAQSELAKVVNELRYISNRLRDQDQELLQGNEWKFAAAVIDRLCLFVFTVVTTITIMAILLA